MSEVKWTKEQRQVIESRNTNLLVSAAAGSGKTAVLIERIIELVLDEKNPIDINKLLVVTFTKLAASEMRERVSKAIEKKLEENPENEHLQKQLLLLSGADITTIDSFCKDVLKSYAHLVNLDNNIKVIDPSENEVLAKEVILLGDSTEDYPIQPKRHTREFLREQAYLRPRTNLFQAVFRIRSVAAMAIHTYFQDRDYLYVHTPLITTADCEGSDQMFKITTLNLDNINGKVDFTKDLFGKKSYITGSGQLHGETFAAAFKNIYTFGPTFRTENSNTKTHANEFWMIEPEIAFCDLDQLMDIEEDMLKFIVKYVLDKGPHEIDFLDGFLSFRATRIKRKIRKIN